MVADDGTPMFPCVDPIDSDPPAIAHNLLRHGRSIGRTEVDDLTAPWAGREHPHGAGRRRARSARLRHLPPRRAALRRGRGRLLHVPDDLPAPRRGRDHGAQRRAQRRAVRRRRDSIHWMRYDRRPYIGRGLPGTFDGGTIHASPAHLRRGDRFLQMYTGSLWTHGASAPSATMSGATAATATASGWSSSAWTASSRPTPPTPAAP